MCGKLQVFNLSHFRIYLFFRWTWWCTMATQHTGGRAKAKTVEWVGKLPFYHRRLKKVPNTLQRQKTYVYWLQVYAPICMCENS